MKNFTKKLSIIALATMTLACTATAENTAPYTAKYSADVPASLITPDSVKTEYAGELTFVDGFPTDETLEKAYRFSDTSRAVELFESGMATASMYAMLNGHAEIGFKANKTVGLTEDLMNARSLWLTPNTTTPYIHTEIDVKNGPVVVEVGTPVIGILDDAFFKYVADVGAANPGDLGKGGKYLLVGEDYKGDIPKGYIVMKTSTYRHWLLMRALPSAPGQSLKESLTSFKNGFKMYPLSEAGNPTPNEFVNLSNKKYSTIHATDASFYNEINEVIQYEPAGAGDPELLGLAKAIGISKGKPFNPDARMQGILKEAAALGNAAGRSVMYKPRNPDVYFYPDRKWYSPLASGSHEFLDANGARLLDDRVGMHFFATGITPFMVKPMIGKGSVYEIGSMDVDGKMLDGGTTYSVTLPGPIPARSFWSFMVYDNHTRSILETNQLTGGLDSMHEGMKVAKDGTVTIFFGPKAPAGQEENWIETVPGKGYNVLLRFYGPEKEWFDKTWKPSDFIPVK